MSSTFDTDRAVTDRYAAAAEQREAALCCPVDYDARYLEVIPPEVIERDSGTGDRSKHVRPGETELDLGSGGGKICFIAAQVVGPKGRVIGVDMNDAMLDLARRSQPIVAQRIGFDNVEFRRGKIQDLALDRDAVDAYLKEHPVRDERSLRELEAFQTRFRKETPMIPSDSTDVVVSNCVLNLVDPADKHRLFAEIFRVLRPGGRAVISDIVADQPVPKSMQEDAQLWSGCISGAFQEHEFLARFEAAGFQGIELETLQQEPWQVVDGIAFRSATVIAFKPPEAAALSDQNAVIYRGPFAKVIDDLGQQYVRGVRTLVDRRTASRVTNAPYADRFVAIAADDANQADRAASTEADIPPQSTPRSTTGPSIAIIPPGPCCGGGEC